MYYSQIHSLLVGDKVDYGIELTYTGPPAYVACIKPCAFCCVASLGPNNMLMGVLCGIDV